MQRRIFKKVGLAELRRKRGSTVKTDCFIESKKNKQKKQLLRWLVPERGGVVKAMDLKRRKKRRRRRRRRRRARRRK